MPITNPKDREQLKNLGFDPDQYNDIAVQQTEQQAPPAKTTTSFGAGARSLLRNLPSSGIGLGVGGLVSSVATPFVGIPAGIMAGMGSKWLQDQAIKGLPDSVGKPLIDSEIQDTAEHPTASAVGGALSSLPFLRPDIKGLGGLAKTLVGGEVTPLAKETGKNLLLNAGLQGGIGATIKGIQQKTLTPELNSDDAISAAIGAILTKPTGLGSKIGLAPKEVVKSIEVPTEKTAPVEYIGDQETPNGGSKKLFNLTEDHPELGVKGSTISDQVLAEKGYKAPEEIPAPVVETKVEEPIVEQPKTIIPEPVKELPSKTSDELFNERSKFERGTPEFQKAHDELMAKMEEESKPKVEEPSKAEDKIATEELNKKLEVAKQEGIDTTDDATVKAIHESPVEPSNLPSHNNDISIPLLRAKITAIESKNTSQAKELASGFTDYFNKHQQNQGQLVNSFDNEIRKETGLHNPVTAALKSPIEYLTQNTPEMREVMKFINDTKANREVTPLSKKGQKIYDIVNRALDRARQEAINRKETLAHESEGFTKGYFPETISGKVNDTFNKDPFSKESQQLDSDFLEYRTKVKGDPLSVATEDLNKYHNSRNKPESNSAARYGPIDKAAGKGLPESWRNPNLMDTVTRYLESVSKRLAYHDAIQIPNLEETIAKFRGNSSVDSIMRDITGHRDHDKTPFSDLFNLVFRSSMGPLSGIKDLASSQFLGWQHINSPVQAIRNSIKAIAHTSENIADLYATGRIRRHMNTFELGNYTEGFVSGLKDLASARGIGILLKRTTNIVSDFSGKNIGDKIGRAFNYGQGKFTTLDFYGDYVKGKLNRTGKEWFDNFGKGLDISKGLSEKNLKEIASRYVDSVQGTYDARGLPSIATDSKLSPILNPARWSIEKANNYIKYTVNPLLNGNPKPFLMSTMGAAIGGATVTALVQSITGRKQNIATINEIKKSKELTPDKNMMMDYFYKGAALADASSHIGILGSILKATMDKFYGNNRPQFFNNILLDAAVNTTAIAKSISDQMRQDGYSHDLMIHGAAKILENQFQTYRLLEGYLSADKQSDIDKANKFRDLRVFNTLSGNKITDLSSPFHVSLDDIKLKQFKNETDLNKVPDEVIPLIDRAWNRSGGNPEKFKRELGSLKQNSYQTFPNPKEKKSFSDYYDFLERTQGKTETLNRLIDYAERNKINQIKSKAIP